MAIEEAGLDPADAKKERQRLKEEKKKIKEEQNLKKWSVRK